MGLMDWWKFLFSFSFWSKSKTKISDTFKFIKLCRAYPLYEGIAKVKLIMQVKINSWKPWTILWFGFNLHHWNPTLLRISRLSFFFPWSVGYAGAGHNTHLPLGRMRLSNVFIVFNTSTETVWCLPLFPFETKPTRSTYILGFILNWALTWLSPSLQTPSSTKNIYSELHQCTCRMFSVH